MNHKSAKWHRCLWLAGVAHLPLSTGTAAAPALQLSHCFDAWDCQQVFWQHQASRPHSFGEACFCRVFLCRSMNQLCLHLRFGNGAVVNQSKPPCLFHGQIYPPVFQIRLQEPHVIPCSSAFLPHDVQKHGAIFLSANIKMFKVVQDCSWSVGRL